MASQLRHATLFRVKFHNITSLKRIQHSSSLQEVYLAYHPTSQTVLHHDNAGCGLVEGNLGRTTTWVSRDDCETIDVGDLLSRYVFPKTFLKHMIGILPHDCCIFDDLVALLCIQTVFLLMILDVEYYGSSCVFIHKLVTASL